MFSSTYSFLTALSVILGVVTGFIALAQVTRSHPKRGTIFALITVGMVVLAMFFANLPNSSVVQSSGATSTPTSGSTTDVALAQVTATSTANPSPTPVPPTPTHQSTLGDILYQSDQSWNGWSGTSDWKIANGMLLNDGTNASYHTQPTISAPYQPGDIADYAVEAKIQVVSALTTNTVYPCFDITVRGVSSAYTWQGYDAGVCVSPQGNAGIGMRDSNTEAGLASIPYNPGNTWHTYRAEVKGTTIKLLIDDGLMVTANDNRFLSGGQIGLLCYNTQIDISSFKVIAL